MGFKVSKPSAAQSPSVLTPAASPSPRSASATPSLRHSRYVERPHAVPPIVGKRMDRQPPLRHRNSYESTHQTPLLPSVILSKRSGSLSQHLVRPASPLRHTGNDGKRDQQQHYQQQQQQHCPKLATATVARHSSPTSASMRQPSSGWSSMAGSRTASVESVSRSPSLPGTPIFSDPTDQLHPWANLRCQPNEMPSSSMASYGSNDERPTVSNLRSRCEQHARAGTIVKSLSVVATPNSFSVSSFSMARDSQGTLHTEYKTASSPLMSPDPRSMSRHASSQWPTSPKTPSTPAACIRRNVSFDYEPETVIFDGNLSPASLATRVSRPLLLHS